MLVEIVDFVLNKGRLRQFGNDEYVDCSTVSAVKTACVQLMSLTFT